MSNLIELSKLLKVRAEVLRERLTRSGQDPPRLDEELSDADVHLLVTEFSRPKQGGLKGLLSRLTKRSPAQSPDSFYSSQAEFEEALRSSGGDKLYDWDEGLKDFPEIEKYPTEEADSSLPTLETPLEEPRSPSSDLLKAERAPEETYPPPAGPEPSSDSFGEPLVPPTPVVPDRMEALEASGDLLDSLGHLEEVSESLAEIPETSVSDLDEEIEDSEDEIPSPDETVLDLLPSATEPEPMKEVEPSEEFTFASSLSSEELQARIDALAADLPTDSVAEQEPRRNPLKGLLAPTIEFLSRLSPKEKTFIAGAGFLAAVLLGVGIYTNRHNYGAGGDGRFYEEGLALQRIGEFDSAADQFRKVLSRYPGSPLQDDAEFRLAEIARAQEDFTEADRRMRSGIRAQLAILGDASEEWTLEEIDKRWKGLFFLGEVNTLREDWESSVDWFDDLIEEATGTAYADHSLYRLANALYHRGKPEAAETWELRETVEAYESALSASPETKEAVLARLRLGETWERFAEREQGFADARLKQSLAHYEDLRLRKRELEEMDIDPIDVALTIARIYRELDRTEDSIRLYRALIEAPRDEFEEGPLPYKVSFGLVRSLLERARSSTEADPTSASAEADLSEALELLRSRTERPFSEEEMTEVVYLRGHAYYQLGVLHRETTGEVQNPYYLKMEIAYQSALSRNDFFGDDGDDSLLASMRRTNYLFTVNKDYSEAARSYENILDRFPNSRYSYLARYRLAEAYFALEDYEKAAAEFEKVVASFASVRYTRRDAFRDAYFKLGYCQFLLEDFVGAARTYKTLLGLLDYENTEEALKAWKRLGWAYYQQGLYDEAAAEYRAFLSRYPEQDVDGSVRVSLGRTLLQRFDHEQARAEFERVIGERPMTEMARWSRYLICESYLTEAAGLEEAKRAPLLEEALTQAEAIRRDYPDEDRVLSILGRLYFELGDYKRAVRELEYYKYSTRNTKPSAEHQLRLAEAYYRLEDYPNAILNFEQIDLADLSRDEAARALYLQAESERLGQQLPESIETYNKMIEQYPTSPLKELAEGRVEEVTWNLSKGLGTASP